MKRYPTLLSRLVWWQSVVLLFSLSILSVALILILSQRLRRHHDTDLVRACREALELIEAAPAVDAGLREELAALGHEMTLTTVADAGRTTSKAIEAEIVLTTRRGGDTPLFEHGEHDSSDENLTRVASCRILSADGQVYEIEARELLGDLQSAVQSLQLVILIVTPLVLVLAIVVATVILGRALGPLRQVVEWVGSVDANQLERRVVIERGPRDINVLVDAFNEMIERLSAGFERMREFSANASHELRTPLTSLTSSLEVVLRRERSAEEYREILEQCLSETQRLTRIVENLLVVAQADAGKSPLRLERVALEPLLMESLEAIHMQSLASEVSLELGEVDRISIDADPQWLRQLFDNLLDNAVKYTPAGGTVRVTVDADSDHATVAVTDTGIGIPRSELAGIFERFRRASTPRSSRQSGIGLGLSIARWVAEAHGGEIRVDSKVGVGSCFEVRLPRRASSRIAV